jgi:hypothetical protein
MRKSQSAAPKAAVKHSSARRYVFPDARPHRVSSDMSPLSHWPRRVRRDGSRLIRLGALLVLSAVAVAAVAVAAHASARELGVGVVAGDPTGGTAKLWLDDRVAVDAGVGFSDGAAFWGDALWHDYSLLPQPSEGKLGLYLGAGPRVETGHDGEFGIRTIGGLSWRLSKSPLELFAEAGPVFRMTQGGGVDADGGVGVRLYLR